ncbi:hypothetical protein EMCRGX_G007521 [Ephydatia muelleri]
MAVPAASDLNSVEFSQGCRRPAGLSGRPDEPGAWPDLSGQGSSLSGRTTPTLSIMQYVGLSGQAVRPAGLRPDPWLAYGNPEFSYSVGTSGVHSWEQSVDPYDPTGHGSRPVRSKKT